MAKYRLALIRDGKIVDVSHEIFENRRATDPFARVEVDTFMGKINVLYPLLPDKARIAIPNSTEEIQNAD